MNKTLKEIQKRIKTTNNAFAAADRPTKVVMLAQDVIEQLKLKRLVADSYYFAPYDVVRADSGEFGNDRWIDWANSGKAASQETLKNTPKCTVCGIGSLFVCAVERVNTFNESTYRENIAAFLNDQNLFTHKELNEIEYAFENSAFRKSLGPEAAMLAVMETIINENGVIGPTTFKWMDDRKMFSSFG